MYKILVNVLGEASKKNYELYQLNSIKIGIIQTVCSIKTTLPQSYLPLPYQTQ